MRTHTPVGDGPALAVLAGQVDRIERDLKDLAGLRIELAHHSAALSRLAEATRTPNPDEEADAGSKRGGPPEWLTVTDPALAITWLNETWMWVQQVWNHYGEMPMCWPW